LCGGFFNQGLLKNFQSKSAGKFSIKVRLKNKDQGLTNPDQIFNRDHDRDENFSIKVRLKNSNQSVI